MHCDKNVSKAFNPDLPFLAKKNHFRVWRHLGTYDFRLIEGLLSDCENRPGAQNSHFKEVLGTRWRRRFRINPVVEHFGSVKF